jgi:outer membrane protein OmpA-like peptidoglycan-associated protein
MHEASAALMALGGWSTVRNTHAESVSLLPVLTVCRMPRKRRFGWAVLAAAVLAAVIVLSFVQLARADTDGTWTWVAGPSGVIIETYSGPGGVVTVPSTLGGQPVTDVGGGAHVVTSQSDITRIVFPTGVIRIADHAFWSSASLSSVVFPATLESIGDLSFIGSALTQVTIPASVSHIGNSAFELCQGLTAAYFLGDEPASLGRRIFDLAAPGFTVHYLTGKSGFAPPPPGPWKPTGDSTYGSYQTAYWGSFTITPTAGPHGTITPASPVAVLESANATFGIVADANYHVADVIVDGTSVGATTTYEFLDVRSPHTIEASFAANAPLPPTAVTYGLSAGKTIVRWIGSVDAVGYEVSVNGIPVGTTGPASSLQIHGILGPAAKLTVTARGLDGTRSVAVPGVYVPASTAKIGTVWFAGNSSRLTASAKKSLRAYAKLVAAQGFSAVRANGYTARFDRGSWAYRKRLSTARAVVVKQYLDVQFKGLGVRVGVTARGHAGENPIATNSTRTGRARNRRVELVLP